MQCFVVLLCLSLPDAQGGMDDTQLCMTRVTYSHGVLKMERLTTILLDTLLSGGVIISKLLRSAAYFGFKELFSDRLTAYATHVWLDN